MLFSDRVQFAPGQVNDRNPQNRLNDRLKKIQLFLLRKQVIAAQWLSQLSEME